MDGRIIGRHKELADLGRFLDAVNRGPAGAVLEGDPGMGKTALWQQCLREAERQSFRILSCRTSGSEIQLSFAALGDLLEDVVGQALPQLPSPQRHALETTLLLAETEGAPHDRRAIGVAFLAVVRLLAAAGPVLVAVDDAQWLDRPSSTVLEYALRRLRDERVGILLSARVEEPVALLLELERSLPDGRVSRMRLDPLSLGATYHVLRSRLGLTLVRPVLRRVHETCGGNPFYALELGRALQRAGPIQPGDALAVPEQLQELLKERLALLPEGTRDALAVVAAVRDANVSLVLTIADRDPTSDALIVAADAGIVELDGDRVRFTHPLYGTAIYAALGPDKRRALHRKIAPIVANVEQSARHLALGADVPDEAVAVVVEAAAPPAFARGAPETAAELMELAITLTPPERTKDLWRRTRQAADYHYRAGAVPRMRTLLETLLRDLPSGADRSDALLWLAVSREDDFNAAVELAGEALREAGDDAGRLIQIQFFLGIGWIVRGDLSRAGVHAQAALAFAQANADQSLVAKAIALVGLLETWKADVTPKLLERGVAIEASLKRPLDFFSSPGATFARRLFYACRFDEARARFETAYGVALERGDAPSQIAALLNLSELEVRTGAWSAAELHADAGYDLVEQLGLEQSRGAFLYVRALVGAHRGRVEDARADAEEALALAVGVGGEIFRIQSLAVLGFLELSRGEARAADAYLRPLPDLLAAAGYREPSFCPVLPNAIEAALDVGEPDRARALAECLEEAAAVAMSPWANATAARCRGMIAAAEGDAELAARLFAGALRDHERLPMPFEHARTLLASGTAARRARQKRVARDSLEHARAIFDELGARLWSERARSELARIGGRIPARAGVLTETEARIAELVAAGSTNREVGDALSLSPRTVAWNLSKVYRKLGLRSRTELAAHVLATSDE